MFRKLYNLARFEAQLRPDGPLLVAQGGVGLDPTGADLPFVRTQRAGVSTVYLPGSSLKGVLRSHAERLLVTTLGEAAAEDPFDHAADGRQRAHQFREDGDRAGVYRASCLADRVFGSTEVAGRFRVEDAFPLPGFEDAANRTEIRFGVAIDRAKQSVRHGPWEQEVVTDGRFSLRGTLENYELWMLGLVLQVLTDLGQGFVQVGHGKSRGFGTVAVEEPELRLLYPGQRPARLEGAGAREAEKTLRSAYGLFSDDSHEVPTGAVETSDGMLQGWTLDGWETLHAVRDGLLGEPWRRVVEREKQETADGP